jgi:protein-S-isoprenylcysteine O-methyltransferase Ste14
MALLFLGPRTAAGLPAWPRALVGISTFAGLALAVAGSGLLAASIFRLGSGNITPLPRPRTDSTLVRSGPYRYVRHPMYAWGIALAYGWALLVHGWLTLAWATALFVFFEIKVTREERWLAERFSDYPEYQRRVRKLIPFLH